MRLSQLKYAFSHTSCTTWCCCTTHNLRPVGKVFPLPHHIVLYGFFLGFPADCLAYTCTVPLEAGLGCFAHHPKYWTAFSLTFPVQMRPICFSTWQPLPPPNHKRLRKKNKWKPAKWRPSMTWFPHLHCRTVTCALDNLLLKVTSSMISWTTSPQKERAWKRCPLQVPWLITLRCDLNSVLLCRLHTCTLRYLIQMHNVAWQCCYWCSTQDHARCTFCLCHFWWQTAWGFPVSLRLICTHSSHIFQKVLSWVMDQTSTSKIQKCTGLLIVGLWSCHRGPVLPTAREPWHVC